MLGRNESQPTLFQMVDVEGLVPSGHRLRKIDAVLDLSFVREAVAPCYSASRGRPSLDPELAIRMLLLGTLYDLSDRELCEEIGMHVGMRWFCRLNLHDPVPDHSTLSKLKERWSECGVFAKLFDRVVKQCSDAGLVSGRHVSIDGTEVRANASMKSLAPTLPEPDIAPMPGDEEPNGGGSAAQEPQPSGAWRGHGQKYTNQTHRSSSDPEARLYRKGNGREARLCYLMHDLIDTRSRVILRRKVSRASSSAERTEALGMLKEVLASRVDLGLPQPVEIASLDAGYGTGEFAADVLGLGVLPHMPLQASPEREPVPSWKRRTSNLERLRKRKQKVRIAEARNRVRELQKSRGYQISRRLRTRSEHTFAEAKTLHGMSRARGRGTWRVQIQGELAGTVQNLKRLIAFRGRPRRATAQPRPQAYTRCRISPPSTRARHAWPRPSSTLRATTPSCRRHRCR